jgi:hypothetical protein
MAFIVTRNDCLISERRHDKRPSHLREAAGAEITHLHLVEVVTKFSNLLVYNLEGKFKLLQWGQDKNIYENQVEDKSGASTRGNSSSTSVYSLCCG